MRPAARRSVALTVHARAAEAELFRLMAQRWGVSVSTWVRWVALEAARAALDRMDAQAAARTRRVGLAAELAAALRAPLVLRDDDEDLDDDDLDDEDG